MNASAWIPLKDRWPVEGSIVLAFGRDSKGTPRYDIAHIDGHAFRPGLYFWDSHAEQLRHPITHWMPLPRSPDAVGAKHD